MIYPTLGFILGHLVIQILEQKARAKSVRNTPPKRRRPNKPQLFFTSKTKPSNRFSTLYLVPLPLDFIIGDVFPLEQEQNGDKQIAQKNTITRQHPEPPKAS